MRSRIGQKYLINPFELTDDDSESDHQIGVFTWSLVCSEYGLDVADTKESYDKLDLDKNNYVGKFNVLKYLYSYPIGGVRHPATAMKLRNEGARAGVEDIALDVSTHSWHGLRIEMKAKNGVQSEIQKKWQKFHLEQGYYSVVCFGFFEARKEIVRYLS